jgi:mannose-6-phosphate isomerase-like protein (cupin superfamily)
MPPTPLSLEDAFGRFDAHWEPRVAFEVNDTQLKVVKMQGSFIWHHHDEEDELFWVVRGKLRMLFEDGEVELSPGELLLVPRGVEHCPVADEEADVVMIEPHSTLNVGNVVDDPVHRPYAPPKLGETGP